MAGLRVTRRECPQAERVDKRLDKVPLAHRLPTLIHPWSTLRREALGAYPIVRYSNRLIKQPRIAYVVSHVSLYTMNLIRTHNPSGHGQRRSPGFGVTLVDVKSLKQTLVPRSRKAPDGHK